MECTCDGFVAAVALLALTLLGWLLSIVFTVITKHTTWYIISGIFTLILVAQLAGWIYNVDIQIVSCQRTNESPSDVSVTKADIDI